MILARVAGNVTAAHKAPAYTGHKMLIVQPVDSEGEDISKPFLSFDTVDAGPGDLVLVQQEGNTARQLLGTSKDPFHSVIVGIVDKVYTRKTTNDS